MAAAFNTVPAEEEPLVEKATTKTKTPWRRLACMSAVVSLALGAAAAKPAVEYAAPSKPAGGAAGKLKASERWADSAALLTELKLEQNHI